jgi:membrane protease YdiL (CAAX protease family)
VSERLAERSDLDLWPVLVGLTGVALLLLRPVPLTSGPSWAVLFALYPALAVASLTTPLKEKPSEEILDPRLVLALGIAAVVVSPLFSGPGIPLRLGPWSIPLLVGAAIAEEALFRRLIYGRLLAYGTAVAIAGSAVAFALVHVPAYGTSALPVDLGAGMLLSWQRWASGTWTVPAATHTAANLIVVFR